MTVDDLQMMIFTMLGPARGLGMVYVCKSTRAAPDEAFLMCLHWSDHRKPLAMYVPLKPPTPELVATLQLYLAA